MKPHSRRRHPPPAGGRSPVRPLLAPGVVAPRTLLLSAHESLSQPRCCRGIEECSAATRDHKKVRRVACAMAAACVLMGIVPRCGAAAPERFHAMHRSETSRPDASWRADHRALDWTSVRIGSVNPRLTLRGEEVRSASIRAASSLVREKSPLELPTQPAGAYFVGSSRDWEIPGSGRLNSTQLSLALMLLSAGLMWLRWVVRRGQRSRLEIHERVVHAGVARAPAYGASKSGSGPQDMTALGALIGAAAAARRDHGVAGGGTVWIARPAENATLERLVPPIPVGEAASLVAPRARQRGPRPSPGVSAASRFAANSASATTRSKPI